MNITKSDIITGIIICAILISALFVIKPTIVSGPSMTPTLQDGNYLILNRLAYTGHGPEHGDIIVLDSDYDGGELLIKRVIGIEGDEIRIDAHDVYRNGQKLEEPYTDPDLEEYDPEDQKTWVVPEDSLFVMGDHRATSSDSRNTAVGCVAEEQIVGRVLVRVWPLDKIGIVE